MTTPAYFLLTLIVTFLARTCDSFGLTNLVTGATCFKSETPTLVDVLITNKPKCFSCRVIIDFGRIRLSVSTVNRSYELSGMTHVTPFRKYGKHSTGPSTYGPWVRTYSKLFSCKSVLTVSSYRAQSNEICTYEMVSRGSLPRVRRYTPVMPTRKITNRSTKRFSDESFREHIESVPFHVSEIFDDTDDIHWVQNNLIMSVINHHAPLKTKFVKGKILPYMYSESRKSINQRNMWRNWHFQNRQYKTARKKYSTLRNRVVKLQRNYVQRYLWS